MQPPTSARLRCLVDTRQLCSDEHALGKADSPVHMQARAAIRAVLRRSMTQACDAHIELCSHHADYSLALRHAHGPTDVYKFIARHAS